MDNKSLDKRFNGKICLITGSSMGIGLSIAERFGLEGGKIIICSRNKKNLEKAEESLKSKNCDFISYTTNINNKKERLALLDEIKQKYGRLDILVCNVAVSPYFGSVIETPEKAYDKIMETNVKNTFLLIQESFELLKVSKNSKILIISSYAAYSPANVIGIYSVSKTALIGLSKVLALELAQFGIRVNCLAPGVIKTKMSETIIDSEFAKDNFMQRTGLPDEISGAAAFLCSDDSSYITGETILIHGGKNTRF